MRQARLRRYHRVEVLSSHLDRESFPVTRRLSFVNIVALRVVLVKSLTSTKSGSQLPGKQCASGTSPITKEGSNDSPGPVQERSMDVDCGLCLGAHSCFRAARQSFAR